MQNIFRLPEEFRDDASLFQREAERFKSGELSPAEFRSFRVPMGVYEQRESDTYMLRVRFPAGGVLPHQMRALAEVARKYGNGVAHVTTRQDIQIHRVLVDDIHLAFAELQAAGLSSRGGGGNTVRNITACHDAGVCPDEVFDTSPYAVGLSEFLLPDPLCYQLPRKYKIVFSGCSMDCPGATVADVGFIAKRRNGSLGFAVYAGGGLGGSSRVAELLEEFIPADEAYLVAEAVKRVFDKHGNRKNRNKARLRFLVAKIGLEAFRELYLAELSELRKAGAPGLDVRAMPGRERPAPAAAAQAGEGFAEWRRHNVSEQRQEGYFLVQIPLMLGDIPSDLLEKLADVVERNGDGVMCTTQWQNLVLRWLHENELAALHSGLSDLGLAGAEAPVLRNMVACAGASTCRLGICLSRGLSKAIRAALEADGLELDGLGDLKIHVSGCPNSCGRHQVADIGFSGAARRIEGRLVPHYALHVGAKVFEGQTALTRGKHTVPARNLPAMVADLLTAFRKSPQCPDFRGFLAAGGEQVIAELASRYKAVPDFEQDKNYYFDWDADEIFSLAGRGPGECGAGVFDLIEVDLASAHDALAGSQYYRATVLAARCLLVTKGQQAEGDAQALQLFTQCFIDEKLVDDSLRGVVDQAMEAARKPEPPEAFAAQASDVSAFVETIQKLYDNMDPSLRFKPVAKAPASEAKAEPAEPVSKAEAAPAARPEIAREADFRGVVCPLNYVKTKMLLDKLEGGEVLSVLLDQEGKVNVPESVAKDGHEVLAVEEQGDQWRVLVRKAQ